MNLERIILLLNRGTHNFFFQMGFYSISMEVWKMFKKTVLALFALLFAMASITPPKANAEVVVGVGVAARPGYGYVAVRPRPYVYVAPAPFVAYAPGYVHPYLYPGRVFVGGPRYPRRYYAYRYAGRRGYGWR